MATISRQPDAFCASAVEAGFDLVLGPRFSTWDGDPPIHNRIMLSASLRITSRLAMRGLNVVPPAGWYQQNDLLDMAEALNRSDVRLAWIDVQTASRSRWPAMMHSLDLLQQLCPQLALIAVGVQSSDRLEDLAARPSVRGIANSGAVGICRSTPPEILPIALPNVLLELQARWQSARLRHRQ